MADELLNRLQRFHDHTFSDFQSRFQSLVKDGQHPTILFIGCSDSRLVPYLLTGTGPGELFIVRNVGAFVPPYDGSTGYHGTSAAIEFAVLSLNVARIIVCGHSHCGGIRALYDGVPEQAKNLQAWLELGREAMLPVQVTPEALRRTEQRAVVLQLACIFHGARSRVGEWASDFLPDRPRDSWLSHGRKAKKRRPVARYRACSPFYLRRKDNPNWI